MSLYRVLSEPGALRAPALVTAFDAWVDAGAAASGAAEHIARDGEVVASFDTDALIDYTSHRPILDVVDGEAKHLAWQDLTVSLIRGPARDLLVFTGPEPDHRWREFSSSVVELALRFGVVQSIALGAIPAAVAHTRPVPLIATASPTDLLSEDDRRPEGLLRVPAAALSVVQMAFADAGVPAVGFYAQIPHYVTAEYASGIVALVERLSRHVGIDFPLGTLTAQAQQQRTELDAIVAGRPEVQEHIERLEALSPEGSLSGRIPSGDEIAAEVEKFLRRREGS